LRGYPAQSKQVQQIINDKQQQESGRRDDSPFMNQQDELQQKVESLVATGKREKQF